MHIIHNIINYLWTGIPKTKLKIYHIEQHIDDLKRNMADERSLYDYHGRASSAEDRDDGKRGCQLLMLLSLFLDTLLENQGVFISVVLFHS